MGRDTGTAKDGFVGGESLVRLSWTKWSVHHSEEGEDVEAGNVDPEGESRRTPATG